MRGPKLVAALAVAGLAAATGVAVAARSHDAAPFVSPKEGKPFDATRAPRARSLRVRVLGHANPGGYSGDVFGHRGHAYLSSWRGESCPARGVRVYDLQNPARPRAVATFAAAASEPDVENTWTEKTIVQAVQTPHFRGDLAVTTFQACRAGAFQGFGLYDVTAPSRPRRLALVRTDPWGSHEIWLQGRGGRAYVYTAILSSELRSAPDYERETDQASTPGTPDFRIVDVSDPSNPQTVGSWGAWKSLGIHPRAGRGRIARNFVHSVITNAAATRAYLSYWDAGTVILDISRPSAPRYLGRTPARAAEPEGDAHSAALGRRGTLLVETHESVGGYPTFWDVSRPSRPVYRGAFRVNPRGSGPGDFAWLAASVHDPKVRGNTAYFSWYQQGVVVADITRLAAPRRIAQFVPPPTRDAEGRVCDKAPCTMVWGVFPMRDYVLASDMVSGLWVFRLVR